MDKELVMQFLSLIGSLAIIIITRYLIPWLKSKIGMEKWNILVDKTEKAVRTAKQIFSDNPSANEQKKQYVISYVTDIAEKYKIDLTAADVEILIEGIYEQIKNERR